MKKWILFAGLLFVCQILLSQVPAQPRFPVVLVQFKDHHFSLENPNALVKDMLTKHNFNYDGATGSVLDYFSDNLSGVFSPSFEVFGPVTLDGRMQDYGKDVYEHGERVGDKAPGDALVQACTKLDPEVEFSRFDQNGDGVVDLVLMVFAGYDQAAGASSDALWAHEGSVSEGVFDGVRLGQYIAVPELAGLSGTHLGGIGLVCHELGHFLGLPDFYDTDFAAGGNAGGVYGFSLMGRGLYNNDGHTPPSINAFELNILAGNKAEAVPQLAAGVYTLSAGEMALSPTATEGEYFLYEYRSGAGWDAPLPRGLVVYHVDQSARKVGERMAFELWENWRDYNGINARASHPCYRLVPSSRPDLLEFDASLAQERMVFPGLDQVLFYEPVDWEGNYTGVQIADIRLEEGGVRFRVLEGMGTNLNGTVQDADGKPLAGALVRMGEMSVHSGEDGFFLVSLPEGETHFELSVSKDGYSPYSQEISMGQFRMKSVSVTLKKADAPRETVLSPYNTDATMGYFATMPVLGGVRLTPEELYPYVGQELGVVEFYPYMTSSFTGDVFLVVDIDGKRVLTRKLEQLVKGPYIRQVVDLSSEHIPIPEGCTLYVGYGSPMVEAQLNFRVGTVYPAKKGRSFYSLFSLEHSQWKDMFVPSAGIYMDVALTATAVENTHAASLVDLGYSYIEPPQGKLKVGDRFPLIVHTPTSVTSVNWTLDSHPVNGNSVELPKVGTYMLHARLKHEDGREETLEVLLEVS